MTVIYDLETIAGIFTYTAINKDTEEIYSYVIHKDRNDLEALVQHLKQCKGQIGFNNINFDYPIIHFILENYHNWLMLLLSAEKIISLIYEKAQYIINTQNQENFNQTVAIRVKDWKIQQLDLFKLWHYNNKARATSLKSLEISMNYPNVMEMPIEHTKTDITLEEVDDILAYNLNDVLATFEFYKRSCEKIDLRNNLIERYKIPCLNFSDSKIGEQLTLKLYCERTNGNFWEIRESRTHRNSISLKECIFDYIKFETREFNKLLDNLKSRVVTSTKGAFEESVLFKGFIYDYGTGGIHGCIKSGVYESDDDYIIIDADVASLYPNIAVLNKLFPAHLGQDFCDVYESILLQRIEAKKAGNMAISDALKLSLNSVYGKSNDQHSFLYDPKYTLITTINGQLMLSMLAELLVLNIPDLQVLQVNTDGLTVKIHKKFSDVYYQLCKQWEKLTKLTLEYKDYRKMIIRDVKLASKFG